MKIEVPHELAFKCQYLFAELNGFKIKWDSPAYSDSEGCTKEINRLFSEDGSVLHYASELSYFIEHQSDSKDSEQIKEYNDLIESLISISQIFIQPDNESFMGPVVMLFLSIKYAAMLARNVGLIPYIWTPDKPIEIPDSHEKRSILLKVLIDAHRNYGSFLNASSDQPTDDPVDNSNSFDTYEKIVMTCLNILGVSSIENLRLNAIRAQDTQPPNSSVLEQLYILLLKLKHIANSSSAFFNNLSYTLDGHIIAAWAYNLSEFIGYCNRQSIFSAISYRHEGIVKIDDAIKSIKLNTSNTTYQKISPAISEGPFIKKEGLIWNVSFESKEFKLPDSRGLAYILKLLRQPNPQSAIAAMELYRTDGEVGGRFVRTATTENVNDGFTTVESLQPLADNMSIQAVKSRRKSIQKMLHTEKAGARLKELQEELNKINEYLRTTTGLKGRLRKIKKTEVQNTADKIDKSIKYAINKFNECGMNSLAKHLKDSIRRESSAFAYRPGSEPPRWLFS